LQAFAEWIIYCHFEDPTAGGDEKSIVIIKVIRFLSSFEMTFYVFCNNLLWRVFEESGKTFQQLLKLGNNWTLPITVL